MPKALELLFSPPQKSRNRFRIATIPFDKIGETPLKTPHFDIFDEKLLLNKRSGMASELVALGRLYIFLPLIYLA
jgi:hypothetical protein